MGYIVGRDKGPNKIVLPKAEISSVHLLAVQNDDNTISIEDLGSSNGTFLNGKKIKRAVFTANDQLLLANTPVTYKWLSEELLRMKKMQRDDFTAEFLELKQVYLDYKEKTAQERKKAALKSALFRLPIPIVLFASGRIFFESGSPMQQMMLYLATPISAVFTFTPFTKKMEQVNEEMRESFLMRYRCPKCGLSLGEQSWNVLAQQKQCARCQATWTLN